MFFRFFDNNNSGYLLGHISSWETKVISNEVQLLILEMEKEKKVLFYSSYENLISDVDSLATELNEYYAKAMEQGQPNEMGYVPDACGYEDGEPNEMEYEEEDKLVGFNIRS